MQNKIDAIFWNSMRLVFRLSFGIPMMVVGMVVGAMHAGFSKGWNEVRGEEIR